MVCCDDPGPDRLRLRLKQLSWTTATVAAAAWFCTFGPLACVLSIAVAKHVLVAILIMSADAGRLGTNPSR